MGLSLVELLIAMVATTIVLGVMMGLFQYCSSGMKKSRAAIDLRVRLIAIEEQLRKDLSQITVDVKPHHQLPALPKGYLEIVEGPQRDYNAENYSVSTVHKGDDAYRGDADDFIAFTIRAPGRPFRRGETSQFAEVAWYVNDGEVRRHFRLLSPGQNGSLERLGYRGNRIAHSAGRYPHDSGLDLASPIDKQSDVDVMLTDVVAFDIQVFDPDARQYVVREPGGPIVAVANPSDIGARLGTHEGQFSRSSRGAFIDLGYNRFGVPGTRPIFVNPAHVRYGGIAVYDTGTSWYDHDEANDPGSNGVDDLPVFGGAPRNGIVDDAEEKASIAPYDAPLRGIQIRIRVADQTTKQVSQITIARSFVPE